YPRFVGDSSGGLCPPTEGWGKGAPLLGQWGPGQNPWIRLVAREVLLVGATAPYLPPHFVRRQEPSPFRLRLRGTNPGLRRAPAAVPSPTSGGLIRGEVRTSCWWPSRT